MGAAFLWGLIAASSLVVGALALELRIGRIVLGLVMAFGAGVLISAVAYDLVEGALRLLPAPAGSPLGWRPGR
jgi:ZIP family zinc transporter